MVKINWDDDAFKDELRRRLKRGVMRAALIVEKAAIEKVSIGQAIETRISKKTGKKYVIGLNPSKPGEPPHVLLARLRPSITHSDPIEQGDQIIVKVGSNVVYAARLEYGYAQTDAAGRTVNQKARPYLRPSLAENQNEVQEAITKG